MMTKAKSGKPILANAEADITLINRYSKRELTPEEVYCFSVILCDNDIDRDGERFTDDALEELAPLFLGKTGIMDHRWSAENQIARLYHTNVETVPGEQNRLGEPLKRLRGSAYMLKSDNNSHLIEAIEAGILKEISVGCAMAECTCSICGSQYGTCGHEKGRVYDGELCVAELRSAMDAYEFSFVAVPAQTAAGVTKSVKQVGEALELLLTADLSGHEQTIRHLVPKMQMALADEQERAERARYQKNAEKYIKI